MKKTLLNSFVLALIALASCKQSSTAPADGGSNSGNFTPPTTIYYKIDGVEHTPNMEIGSADMNAGSFTVRKPFDGLSMTTANLRLFFSGHTGTYFPNLRDSIPEGGYRAFPITKSTDPSIKDSIRVEVDVDQYGSKIGTYFFKASSGTIYISKKNDTLRYTSNGKLHLTGYKYMGDSGYVHDVEFSIKDKTQF